MAAGDTQTAAPSRFRPVHRELTPDEQVAVRGIKDLAEEMEKLMQAAGKDPRSMALAVTNLEQAVMWAVKGITA